MPRLDGVELEEELLASSRLAVELAKLGRRDEVERLRATIALRAPAARSARVYLELLLYEAEELLLLGWPTAARGVLLRALEESISSRLDEGKLHAMLATACLDSGDLASADAYARRAIDLLPLGAAEPWRARAVSVMAAVAHSRNDRQAARRILEGVLESTPSARDDAGILIDLALMELIDGAGSAAARLRTARMLADARGEQTLSVLARLAIACEEALRGDLDLVWASLDNASQRGAGLPFVAPLVRLVKTIIEARRVDALVAAGDRKSAIASWTAALAAAGEIEKKELVDASPRFFRFAELARTVLLASDPHRAWVVGPRSTWIEEPNGDRVDLTRFPLLRTIFATLFHRHTSERPTVTTLELCAAAWPDDDAERSVTTGEPRRDDVLRNRMKVALSKMRQLGLRDALRRVPGGQRLAPEYRFIAYRPNHSAI